MNTRRTRNNKAFVSQDNQEIQETQSRKRVKSKFDSSDDENNSSPAEIDLEKDNKKIKFDSDDEQSSDDEKIQNISTESRKRKILKLKDSDESSSDSSVGDYLKPADEIDLNSSFFQFGNEKPPDFCELEKKMFSGIHRLSDSEESDLENVETEKKSPVPTECSQEISTTNFTQINNYNKKLEEAKACVQKYEKKIVKQDKKVRKDKNIVDISTLLLIGEKNNRDSIDSAHISSEDEQDWEEIEDQVKEEPKIPKEGVQITVELPGVVKRKKKSDDLMAAIKRRINRIKKENQVYVHKVHLLCWIAHGNFINNVLNNEILLGKALSLLPSEQCYPPKNADISYLEQIVRWYGKIMKLSECSPDNQTPVKDQLTLQINKKQANCKRNFILLFIIILRSLGLQCRLILSFQCLPIRPASSELCSLSTKDNKNDEKSKSSSKSNKSKAPTVNTSIKNKIEKKLNDSIKHKLNSSKSLDTSKINSPKNKNLKQINKSIASESNKSKSKMKVSTSKNAKDTNVSKYFSAESNSEKQIDKNNKLESNKNNKSKSKTGISKNVKDTNVSLYFTAESNSDNEIDKNNELESNKNKKSKSKTKSNSDKQIDENIGLKNNKSKSKNKPATSKNVTGKEKLEKNVVSPYFSPDTNSKIKPSSSETKSSSSKTKTSSSESKSSSSKTKSSSSETKPSSSKTKLSCSESKPSSSETKSSGSKSRPSKKPSKEKLESPIKISQVDGADDSPPRKNSSKSKLISEKIKKNLSPSDSDFIAVHREKRKSSSKPVKYFESPSTAESDCQPSTSSPIKKPSKDINHNKPSTSKDVRNDIISIIKGGMMEQRYKEQLKTKKKSNDSDYDSDFVPEVITLKKTGKKISSSDEFVNKIAVNTKVKRRIPPKSKLDRRAVSSDEETEIKKKGNDIWLEVFLEEEEKWISVDLIKGQVHCISEIYNRASHPLSYVVAWNNNLSLKDISARYCPNWNTVTRKLRVDQVWWNATLKPFIGTKTIRDKEEDEDLARQQLDKPLPTTISEYKNHPLYALKRHLLKFEAIYPPDAVILGFVRKEPVYARECVHTLHSREIWVKQAKVVRPKQEPYKIVKARPKYDKLTGNTITDLPLEIFGSWQVEDYIPPTAENGIVPRNAFGNVELFKSCMLPKKTVHLQLPGLNRIAKKLRIDCAPAVVGFDYHCGGSHPTFDGFVVCEEFEDTLIAAWEQDREETAKREQEKYDKRVYGNWRKLIKGLLIRERLKARYDFGNETEKKVKPSKSKKAKTDN